MTTDPGFNLTHPELCEGEMFAVNMFWEHDNIPGVSYKSKRMGKKAYTANGNPLGAYRPVFISIEEYNSGEQNV